MILVNDLPVIHLQFGRNDLIIPTASVKPARSPGPALVAAIRGNSAPLADLWVFIVGSLVGAALAVFTYKALETKEVFASFFPLCPASAEGFLRGSKNHLQKRKDPWFFRNVSICTKCQRIFIRFGQNSIDPE
ncbi:MAG: aquaporin [Clostridia bacterium]|nr:aquaporin [Clostridia bacterium]